MTPLGGQRASSGALTAERRPGPSSAQGGAARTLAHDDLWPRDEAHRFRLYARVGRELTVLAAAPDAAGIGVAIATLDDDARQAGRRLCDEGRLGILDVLGPPAPTGNWLIPLWDRGAR